jgi:hypothetical protein
MRNPGAVPRLAVLEIMDSVNFSAHVLRLLVAIAARKSRVDPTLPELPYIKFLSVCGDCPALSQRDMGWYNRNSERVRVCWIREWDGGNQLERFDNFHDPSAMGTYLGSDDE